MVRPLRLVGGLIVAPRSALASIDRQGGGVQAALVLLAAGTLAFRMPELVMAVRGASFGMGVLARLVSVVGRELGDALWVVLPAALAITVLAGRRRDPGVDIELGAACYVPWFVVQAPLRAAAALGVKLPGALATGGAWVGLAAALTMAVLGTLQARRRPTAERQPTGDGNAPQAPGRAPAFAAAALALVLLAALAGGVMSARRPRLAATFSLPRVDGAGEVSLAAQPGTVVLLDFWATWCPPCVAMVPTLRSLHETWGPRGLTIIGVNADGPGTDPAAIREFAVKEKLPYAVVVDDGRVSAHYGVASLPHLVLIGADGQVRQTFWGPTSASELDAALRRELGAASR